MWYGTVFLLGAFVGGLLKSLYGPFVVNGSTKRGIFRPNGVSCINRFVFWKNKLWPAMRMAAQGRTKALVAGMSTHACDPYVHILLYVGIQ
jgi:hypothetical protein